MWFWSSDIIKGHIYLLFPSIFSWQAQGEQLNQTPLICYPQFEIIDKQTHKLINPLTPKVFNM